MEGPIPGMPEGLTSNIIVSLIFAKNGYKANKKAQTVAGRA